MTANARRTFLAPDLSVEGWAAEAMEEARQKVREDAESGAGLLKEFLTELENEVREAFAGVKATRTPDIDDEDEVDDSGENLPVGTPNVAIQRISSDLLIEVDLPGVDPATIKTTVSNSPAGSSVEVYGIRRPAPQACDVTIVSDTTHRGPVRATFDLPVALTKGDMNAVLRDGVLELFVGDVFAAPRDSFEVEVEIY